MTNSIEKTSELLVDFIVSLDGYAAADGWPGWWGLEGPEYLQWLEEQPEKDYTVVMGAKTYQMFSSFVSDEPSPTTTPEEDSSFDAIAAMNKIVLSSSIHEATLPNTRIFPGDAVATIAELKKHSTENLRTLGSLSICRSLLAAGLVDRFRIVVFPVITGQTGRDWIYDRFPDLTLELLSTRTFDGRLQLLEYRPAIAHSDS